MLLYSAEHIFELINDVSSYPAYMDGCVGAEVLYRSADTMEARLDLAKKGIKYSLTTRNRLTPPSRVDMELVDGPFTEFHGCWEILPLNESACKVSLNLSFALQSQVLNGPLKALLNSMADNLVDALVQRARQTH